MNEKRNRLAVFFGRQEPKIEVRKVGSISELKGKMEQIYNEIEERIQADSARLDELGEKRQKELLAHEQALKNLMDRHANIMEAISFDESMRREDIQQAIAMKNSIARVV